MSIRCREKEETPKLGQHDWLTIGLKVQPKVALKRCELNLAKLMNVTKGSFIGTSRIEDLLNAMLQEWEPAKLTTSSR